MAITVVSKDRQAYGAFNGGEIVENKPIGFNREGGEIKPYSNLFYWAYAEAKVDSTIGLHPHQGFEIMSFVLNGTIRHYDTKLKEWRSLSKGDAQIIRAGNGISHAEHMAKDAVMFQIWVDPDLEKTMQQAASYDDYQSEVFPITSENGITIKTYIGQNSPFQLDTKNLEIHQWNFDNANFQKAIATDKIYSIYVQEGAVVINDERAEKDSFIVIENEAQLKLENEGAGQLFIITSPKEVSYKTYRQIMQERMSA